MTERDRTTVGIIGLGAMGSGMARALLAAGLAVRGFDLSPTARQNLAALGGTPASSAGEAAQDAAILVMVVVNAQQTEDILFGPDGTAARLAPGAVVVSCATMAPDDARRLEARAREHGLLYVDAPMSGGTGRAASGELSFMASGHPDAFTRAEPALNAMAATLHRLGDEAGIGSAFKMVNQLLAGVHIAAACEAVALAARLGLDLQTVYDVIRVSAGTSWMFENRVPHILDGDYAPRSAVDIFVKDLGIVTDMGRASRFPTPLAALAMQMFVMTSAAGMGRDDDASVARLLADLANVKLPSGT
ncbi:3-hydroxyisobutyrate dehydrogenase [Aureimonas jatrophae]|uniref:L-threonate dehydrogenase n=2 Tax=Aureimonas jatrophae TaxID=1166073 RepID=A0A1H0L7L2_9HYPH|nr:L-threonate dehydrogenase [Aureimonas jatrophae]MBB3952433.1 3-hydroxyisobutyrate dehydrogenase [Aureimonas jatrophae]SDO63930.1 3-hydroxyisobutyrate dehydrogenase [Aureimonas jatrophae]